MPDLFVGQKTNAENYQIVESEFHHCIRVMRNSIGSEVLVTDFDGIIHTAIIQNIEKDKAILEIKKIYKTESTDIPKIAIAISLTSPSDRLEWFVEKAVENGVHEIFPMLCERTEVKKVNIERLLRVVKAAAKQTIRPLLPQISDLKSFDTILNNSSTYPQQFIGHCQDDLEGFLGKLYDAKLNTLVYIGPAGDFSAKEIKNALDKNCIPVSLGPYRLRTETAGLTAIQILQTIKQL
ncbi:MAG: 16S rRNA (uracil(1498)-N(3))-methyltransferase [Saprospiraceae bacterium]|nr:16S rRNA (uracil(1498)-N(3))-methyltransferase [Saprospiraceae bacterium]